jgi:hypothetical protein
MKKAINLKLALILLLLAELILFAGLLFARSRERVDLSFTSADLLVGDTNLNRLKAFWGLGLAITPPALTMGTGVYQVTIDYSLEGAGLSYMTDTPYRYPMPGGANQQLTYTIVVTRADKPFSIANRLAESSHDDDNLTIHNLNIATPRYDLWSFAWNLFFLLFVVDALVVIGVLQHFQRDGQARPLQSNHEEQSQTITSKEKPIFLLFSLLAVFFGIYVYFANVQPVVPWTADDWLTLSGFNSGVFPVTHNNDPGRVTPKIIGPITGHIIAFVVYPLTKDYLFSITVAVAALIALLMAAFYLFSYRLFHKLGNNKALAVCASFFFIILYFAMFKSRSSNNVYMLWHYNLCTVFYYLLPNILNSILVFWLWEKRLQDSLPFKYSYSVGILICVLYLAMFSMLWGAAILACYAFFDLLAKLPGIIKKKERLTAYWINMLILIFFCGYCFVEFTGERGNVLSQPLSLRGIKETLLYVCELLIAFNTMFLVFAYCVIALYLYLRIKDLLTKEATDVKAKTPILAKLNRAILLSSICTASTLPFYLLAATKSGFRNHNRIEGIYGFFFFFILTLLLICLHIVNRLPKSVIAIPFIIMIFAVHMTRSYYPLSAGEYNDTSAHQKYEIVAEWLGQIKAAEIEGGDYIVPKILPTYPAVFPSYWEAIEDTLKSHKIIRESTRIIYEYE